jgi:Cu/Ag efflux protein CusF
MGVSISRRIAAEVLAIGLAGSVGVGATAAFATSAKTASGTVKSVTAKSDHLVLSVGKSSDSFTTTAMTKIDLGGKTSSLAKLKKGDKATVTYTTSGMTLTATSIDATA